MTTGTVSGQHDPISESEVVCMTRNNTEEQHASFIETLQKGIHCLALVLTFIDAAGALG
jgi:hypothetical protein